MKKILLTILPLLFWMSASSQMKLRAIVSFDYSYGFSQGSLNDYIPNKSFDGFQFQWRYFCQRNFSVGIRSGYNNFRDRLPRAIYETDRGTVSAVQTRYFHSIPFLATGYYYLRSLHYVMPYFGGGIGAYALRYEKYFGVVPDRNTSVRFGFSPEAGVVIPFHKTGIGLMVMGRYTKAFYSRNEISNINYFEAAVGIYFGYPVFDDSFLKK